MSNVFYEIGAMLAAAAAASALALLLRQPLIVAFIAVGILVGPAGFGWVMASDEVDLLAKLGVALLLFVVGLKLDPRIIRSLGPVALATGLGQVVFTSVVGYLIAIALGMETIPALYVAIALTFSSTIIIVKLLSDKREVDSLYGRIAVGFLIVQDIVVVLVMIALTAVGEAAVDTAMIREVVLVIVKGLGMLAMIGLLMRHLLPMTLHRFARTPEMLVLFAVAWAVAWAAVGDLLGFSKQVGAFLAGVSIAATPYRELIAARLVTLRDFMLLFFFIDLGANVDIGTLGMQLGPAAVFSAFVLIGNPLIVMIIMGAMGYRKRTGFLAGLTVAQISEFSLILAALGLSLGHIGAETVGLITLVGLVTISVSTYMILYSHRLYEWAAPWLGGFERDVPHREEVTDTVPERDFHLLVIGLGRFGSGIAHVLRERGHRLLAVDFDPEAVRRHANEGYATRYGDAEDPEFIAALPLARVDWIVCTVRERSVNRTLLHALREQGYRGRVALAAAGEHEAEEYRRAGADVVLVPYADAAREAADRLFEADRKGRRKRG